LFVGCSALCGVCSGEMVELFVELRQVDEVLSAVDVLWGVVVEVEEFAGVVFADGFDGQEGSGGCYVEFVDGNAAWEVCVGVSVVFWVVFGVRDVGEVEGEEVDIGDVSHEGRLRVIGAWSGVVVGKVFHDGLLGLGYCVSIGEECRRKNIIFI